MKSVRHCLAYQDPMAFNSWKRQDLQIYQGLLNVSDQWDKLSIILLD